MRYLLLFILIHILCSNTYAQVSIDYLHDGETDAHYFGREQKSYTLNNEGFEFPRLFFENDKLHYEISGNKIIDKFKNEIIVDSSQTDTAKFFPKYIWSGKDVNYFLMYRHSIHNQFKMYPKYWIFKFSKDKNKFISSILITGYETTESLNPLEMIKIGKYGIVENDYLSSNLVGQYKSIYFKFTPSLGLSYSIRCFNNDREFVYMYRIDAETRHIWSLYYSTGSKVYSLKRFPYDNKNGTINFFDSLIYKFNLNEWFNSTYANSLLEISPNNKIMYFFNKELINNQATDLLYGYDLSGTSPILLKVDTIGISNNHIRKIQKFQNGRIIFFDDKYYYEILNNNSKNYQIRRILKSQIKPFTRWGSNYFYTTSTTYLQSVDTVCVNNPTYFSVYQGGNEDSIILYPEHNVQINVTGIDSLNYYYETIGQQKAYVVRYIAGESNDTARTEVYVYDSLHKPFRNKVIQRNCPNESYNVNALSEMGTDTLGITIKWADSYTGNNRTLTKAGKYAVTLSRYGCSIIDSIQLNDVPRLSYLLAQKYDSLLCPTSNIVATTSITADSYLWSTGDTSKTITLTSPSLNSYGTISNIWLQRKYPCNEVVTDTYSYITFSQPGNVMVNSETKIAYCKEGLHTLAVGISGNPPTIFGWSTGDSAALFINVDTPGNYTFTGIWPCFTQIKKFIVYKRADCDSFIYHIPNSFSPDENSLNDLWKPEFYMSSNVYLLNYQLSICNRWGQVLWQTTDYTKGWNGYFNGNLVPDGSYIYQLYIRANSGETVFKSGFIYVNR